MKIDIYQTVYDHKTADMVSPFAQPLPIDNSEAQLFEYQCYRKMLNEGLHKNCDYIGLFSPKFSQKSNQSVLDILHWIHRNPGYDIYTFNPFPHEAYFFFNQWDSGEFHHPGLKDLARSVFDAFGFQDIDLFPRMAVERVVYCNFWVASGKFFSRYVEFLNEVTGFILQRPEQFLADTRHRGGMTPFFPFLIERLFSTYLHEHRKEVSVRAFTYPKSCYAALMESGSPADFERRSLHLNLVVDKIDALDAQYRNGEGREEHRQLFEQLNSQARREVSQLHAARLQAPELLSANYRSLILSESLSCS